MVQPDMVALQPREIAAHSFRMLNGRNLATTSRVREFWDVIAEWLQEGMIGVDRSRCDLGGLPRRPAIVFRAGCNSCWLLKQPTDEWDVFQHRRTKISIVRSLTEHAEHDPLVVKRNQVSLDLCFCVAALDGNLVPVANHEALF